jgi:hypothetical protein
MAYGFVAASNSEIKLHAKSEDQDGCAVVNNMTARQPCLLSGGKADIAGVFKVSE